MSIFTKTKQRIRRRKLTRLGVIPSFRKNSKLFGGDHGWVIDESKIKSDSVIYSVGVGSNIDFDLALINEFNVVIHAFDPTPRSVEWVKNQSLPDNFKFHPIGLAAENGTMNFFPPARASSTHFSPVKRYDEDDKDLITAPVKNLETIASELNHNFIDLLKMDIEGAEYEVIDSLISNGVSINQILIEFHHMYKGIPINKTIQAVRKLEKMGFELFNISQRTYEFSFIKKDLSS